MKSYFGLICPQCQSTVDIGVGSSAGPPLCPNPTCKTPMVPNPQTSPVAVNVYCPTCSASYRMVNSDKCPRCGGAFELNT